MAGQRRRWVWLAPDADGRTPARVRGGVLIEADALDLDAVGWWRGWGPGAAHR